MELRHEDSADPKERERWFHLFFQIIYLSIDIIFQMGGFLSVIMQFKLDMGE